MNNTDKEYFRLLNLVLEKGRVKKNRTGVDTIGTFGAQARFDLSEGFPLLTTKKVFTKGIIHELLWFIKGDTNIKYLVDNGVNIWNEWAYKKYVEKNSTNFLTVEDYLDKIKTNLSFAAKWGELGEGTYGGMWRGFPYAHRGDRDFYDGDGELTYGLGRVDQLKKVVDKLKTSPDDRRLIVSAWHPYFVDNCALPPCHCLFQFHTEELTLSERRSLAYEKLDRGIWESNTGVPWPFSEKELNTYCIPTRRLNCQLYQRSCDLFLGVPFNIASYSLLIMMMAQVSNMVPGEFVWTAGDLHIYTNHLEQVKLQLSRESRKLPAMKLNPDVKDLFSFKYEDFTLEGYDPHPAIKGEVAV